MSAVARAEAVGRTIGEGIKKWWRWVQAAGAAREQRRQDIYVKHGWPPKGHAGEVFVIATTALLGVATACATAIAIAILAIYRDELVALLPTAV